MSNPLSLPASLIPELKESAERAGLAYRLAESKSNAVLSLLHALATGGADLTSFSEAEVKKLCSLVDHINREFDVEKKLAAKIAAEQTFHNTMQGGTQQRAGRA